MELETIEILKNKKVSTIRLNRPDLLNAVNEQLVWDLQEATQEVMNDEDTKVVILTGAGLWFFLLM